VSDGPEPLLRRGDLPFLAVPLVAGPVLVALNAAGATALLGKPLQEQLGPPLLAVAALAWLLAWRRGGSPAARWVFVLGLVLLAREINFDGADLAFALAALGLGAWAWAQRRRLLPAARELPARGALLAVPLLYALAQLADLRPVRIATGGIGRVSLEEPLETIGHALFLLAGVEAAWVARRRPFAAATSP
jgi:hypothetical protein